MSREAFLQFAKIARRLSVAFVYLSAVIIAAGVLSYLIITAANDMFAFVGEERTVKIELDDSVRDTDALADALSSSGAVEYPLLFVFYAEKEGYTEKYVPVAGEYVIDGRMSYREILNLTTERKKTQ